LELKTAKRKISFEKPERRKVLSLFPITIVIRDR
jgi:hypothetical protein